LKIELEMFKLENFFPNLQFKRAPSPPLRFLTVILSIEIP
jgi:hypothetical protein